jgi:hypothetical protein
MMTLPALLLATTAQADDRFFSCEQVTLTDPPMVEHLDLTIDRFNRPVDFTITRVQSGLEILAGMPSPRPGYDGGYWWDHYGLRSYKLGTFADWTSYFLLIPGGVVGSRFDAQVHLWFDRGAAGWWANEFECVEV